ncbi:hypothetical protein [uncultured Winogradskyella sp.]|mgnify:CR=1 FL=1|uniref:hypothetical protein n=1 Tax=uncultured Winogradskyella sp. TaxID=395353 RepID=UPI003513F24C
MNKIKFFLQFVILVFLSCDSNSDDTNQNNSNIFNGSIVLSSQEEVDDFGSNGYEIVTGNIQIVDTSNNIVDLSSLNSIKRIERKLTLFNCQNLIEINGFNALEYVEDFVVSACVNLTNISGLDNLETISRSIFIGDNASLENITLEVTGNSMSFECNNNSSLEVVELPNLNELDFFRLNNLSINISFNFQSLNTVNEYIRIIDNLFTTLDGFDNLSYCREILFLDNPGLVNITAFENISEASAITLINNPLLSDISGFSNLQVISSLHMDLNETIENIDGLSGLTQITNRVRIRENVQLNNLNGLINVNSIGDTSTGEINITGNLMLSDLCGISNAVVNGNFNENYLIEGNLLNPTQEDFINGICN